MSDAKLKWPFGLGDSVTLTAAGAQALAIDDNLVIIDGVTVEATSDRTLDLTINSEIKLGAMILVKSKTNGTQDTIFGTGITAPTITGVAGKTFTQGFKFDGTTFLPEGLSVQID